LPDATCLFCPNICDISYDGFGLIHGLNRASLRNGHQKAERPLLSSRSSAASRAPAAVLGVVQPMLSRQVRSLEEELGVQLVHRNGRGIVLTEAGSLLNEYAKGILATLARAESEVGALRANPRGNVVIGMPPSMGSVLTVPLIQSSAASIPPSICA
jgi:hypothetical protein